MAFLAFAVRNFLVRKDFFLEAFLLEGLFYPADLNKVNTNTNDHHGTPFSDSYLDRWAAFH